MATINDHLSNAELEARYKTAADPVAKSHFHALWLLSSGYGIAQVAELLSFSTRWIRLLINRYNQDGPEALGDRRAGNGAAPKILTPAAGGAQGAGQNAARRRRPHGAARRSPAGWLGFMALRRCMTSAAGTRSSPSTTRCSSRGLAIPRPRTRRIAPRSKKARGGRR